MKAALLFLFFFVAVAVAVDTVEEYDTVEVEWPKYKKNFDKNYTEEEEAKRLAIFTATLQKIKEHNEKYKKGDVSYSLGINQFADLTADEVPRGRLPYPGAQNQTEDPNEQHPNLHGLTGH